MQVESDQRLIESLITSKKIDAFVRKYREIILDIIDKQMYKIDSSATLTLARKVQLMNDFIENLLANDSRLLQNYLHPKRLRTHNTNAGDLPSLDVWIHQQCVRFFNAKLIVDGILSKNINVIKTFFFSKERPGCREMFSKWICINHVFEGDNPSLQNFIDKVIREYVNVLYVDIDKDAKEQLEISAGERQRRRKQKDYEYSALTSLKSYRFEGDFYSYFRDSVVHPYLKRKFLSKPTPIRPSIDDIYNGENEDTIKPLKPNPIILSIDDKGENGDNRKQIEIVSPDDSFQEYEYREFLERIFSIMERTAKGREQVDVLKLVFHLVNFEDCDIRKDQDIAKVLNISPRMLNYKKEQALKTARNIAEALGLKFY